MTPRDAEEYRALRATIRERGSMRVWVFVAGLLGWAGLAVATAALATLPVATLLPLLVLAGIFDAVYVLHTGVERVGRYVQVFYEADEPGWEQRIMAFGRQPERSGAGVDALFSLVFIGAAILNFIPVMIAEAAPIELGVIGGAHLLFIIRVLLARRTAAHQRARDLERFQRLKQNS